MTKKTILVCDDDEGILDMLGLILSIKGFEVIAEQNSLRVAAVIEQKKPDLLLLDLWMPALNGDQVLRILRANPATSQLPVIMISASPEAKQIAGQAGANSFISKPFQINDLVNEINSTLTN